MSHKEHQTAEKNALEHRQPSLLKRFWIIWRDGFKNMTWGKPLWILNIIKLIIMFGILKIFFFPNFLKTKSGTPEGRREYVRHELIERGIETMPEATPTPQQ